MYLSFQEKTRKLLDITEVIHALTFLEEEKDSICLQVPSDEDMEILSDFLTRGVMRCLWGLEFVSLGMNKLVTTKGVIFFEFLETSDRAGTTHNCPHFSIAYRDT